jgi:hypothetical protein
MEPNRELSIILRPQAYLGIVGSAKNRIVAEIIQDGLLLAKRASLADVEESPEAQYERGRSEWRLIKEDLG